MPFFSKALCPSLFLAANGPGDVGAAAFILPSGAPSPSGDGIDLAPAFSDQTLAGSFLFALTSMDFGGDAAKQTSFVSAVQTILARMPSSRAILWIADPAGWAAGNTPAIVPALGMTIDGTTVSSALSAPVAGSLSMQVGSGMTLTVSGDMLAISSTQQQFSISFSGASAPVMSTVLTGTLPFSGLKRGCVQFGTFLQRQSLNDSFGWGFTFGFAHATSPQGMISEWLPLANAAGPTSTDMLGFDAAIDPLDPFNLVTSLRTSLSFTGANQDGSATSLASYYRTGTGAPVTLWPATGGSGVQPAALVFNKGRSVAEGEDSFYCPPAGDFVIQAPLGPDGATASLLCGLQGTEFLTLVPGVTPASGASLRFVPNQPAYAPVFPLASASPVGPPIDPSARPLSADLLTSWVCPLPPAGAAQGVFYVAQPKGFPLYGYDKIVAPAYPALLGAVEPGLGLSAAQKPFPMPCYAGVTPGDGSQTLSSEQIALFESQMLSPIRRGEIGGVGSDRTRTCDARAAAAGQPSPLPGGATMATPTGLLVTLQGDGPGWGEVLLAKTVSPADTQMSFSSPSGALESAFQTGPLFLVVANAEKLVEEGGNFSNQLNIGNWLIEADIGNSPAYNDYANIMIVKGIKGPLYDPKGDPSKNLIANPEKWTQPADFAAPSVGVDAPDSAQMVNLSQWLQDYFAAAAGETDSDFFTNFNTLAARDDWTGILVLRARIAAPPDDIAGILAGVKDPSRFYAHHLAISSNPLTYDAVNRRITVDQQSSVYGLIYYLDPGYDRSQPTQPIPPEPGAVYDFTVLSLKVQFENTAVKRFESMTQLTLTQLFGSTVSGMGDGGNTYNAILLEGGLQNNNGVPAYSLGAVGDLSYLFDSNIYNKIEITSAQLTTVSAEPNEVVSKFQLSGFIDFKILAASADATLAVDLLSFGSPSDGLTPRSGLAFTSLALDMSFNPGDASSRTIAFDAGAITFNLQTSTPRGGSLFTALSLDLQGLTGGTAAADAPTQNGYLPVVTDIRLSGLADAWYGLKFGLNLGTPGALAGAVGLNATLLLAWSPASSGASYQAQAAVQMPGASSGAKLISLQTVLSMSYGVIQLLLVPTTDGKSRQFMLVLNSIAIKFLGLLKIPPSGNTAFYLFGGDESSGQSGLGWFAVYNQETSENIRVAIPPARRKRRR